MENQVELKDAKYIVMNDFDPDSYVCGYKTLEEAKEELSQRDFPVDSFIVEVIERKPAVDKAY